MPDDFESCLALYESKRALIEKVKNILFPHQNNIEQGRALTDLLGDARASHIGDELDPEHEQLQENDGKVATEMDANDVVRYPDELVSDMMTQMKEIVQEFTIELIFQILEQWLKTCRN